MQVRTAATALPKAARSCAATPASRQHRQAALASSTRASGQPSVSLPWPPEGQNRERPGNALGTGTPWERLGHENTLGEGNQSHVGTHTKNKKDCSKKFQNFSSM